MEYFRTQLKHRDVQAVVFQGLDRDLTFHVVQLLLVHFGESPDGLMILADVSIDHCLLIDSCDYTHTIRLLFC